VTTVKGYTGELAGVRFDDGHLVTARDEVADPTGVVRAVASYARRHGLTVIDGRLVVTHHGERVEPSPDADESADVQTEVAAVPARNAAKAAWLSYVIAQGADPDDAAAATRDQLAERYGVKED
jgi:hypothetical protein